MLKAGLVGFILCFQCFGAEIKAQEFSSPQDAITLMRQRRSGYCQSILDSLGKLREVNASQESDPSYLQDYRSNADWLTSYLMTYDERSEYLRQTMSDDMTEGAAEISTAWADVTGDRLEERADHLRRVLRTLEDEEFVRAAAQMDVLDDTALNPWADHFLLGPFTNSDLHIGLAQSRKISERDYRVGVPSVLAERYEAQRTLSDIRDLTASTFALKSFDPNHFFFPKPFSELEAQAEIFISLTVERMGQRGINATVEALETMPDSAFSLIYLMENYYPGFLSRPESSVLRTRMATYLTDPDPVVRLMSVLCLYKWRSLMVTRDPSSAFFDHPLSGMRSFIHDALLTYQEELQEGRDDSSGRSGTYKMMAALYIEILHSSPKVSTEDLALADEVFACGEPVIEGDLEILKAVAEQYITTFSRQMYLESVLTLIQKDAVLKEAGLIEESSVTKDMLSRFLSVLADLQPPPEE